MVLATSLGGCRSVADKVSKEVEEVIGSKDSKDKDTKRPTPKKKEEEERHAEAGTDEAPLEAEEATPAQSYSREWVVSPSGSDEAAGSRENPFRTIRRAIEKAGPGEVIRVQAGQYAESVVIDGKARKGTKDAPITLLGEGEPKIVPGKSSGALLQVRRPYWIIEGFEIDVRGQSRFAAVFEGDTQGATLKRSHLHGGTLGGGITTYGQAHGVRIERNHIHDFHKPGGDDSHGIVIQATSRDIVIRGNDIHDTSGDAVQCLKPDSGSQAPAQDVVIERNKLHATGENAVDIKTCRDVVVRHNRMHDFKKSSSSAGEAVVVHYSAKNVRIEDNEISKAGKGIAVGGVTDGANPTDVVVSGNTIREITSSGGSDGAGIRVENASKVKVEGNTIEDTDGYGMMLGLGANGAPSSDLTVKDNVVRTEKLVRLGKKRPGLRMESNRYAPGGLFKAEPKETRDFSQWKEMTGVDKDSSVEH
ncbi:right-handed parallel beta-helix repeat-containing protein [Hyalangium rubrum]|uniref:Right-handed parallel beta-helix repeat-containing protein n=1 Tax=Hyalangium rubrum TaxID=3103134 RepID=A0ABU5H5E2_9BACT|nr:right-handed parallel beta-helix repeat-containing protein [Hyalangium sp. s54d21]MDY7228028.1 right-handed parallel beta-helix repeat-containing protein [Hyalangium sp. s54d21]